MSESNLIFSQKSFEDTARDLRTYIIDYIMAKEPTLADRIIHSISNSGELLSILVEAVAAYTIDNTRKLNFEADDLSRLTVRSVHGVDRLVANQGLTRAVVGEENGKPIMESNESLLTRFDLSHYQANTTGTRFGYKFHALCYGVDERPVIDVKKVGDRQVQLTYTFPTNDGSGIADAEFRSTEKGTGKVQGAATPKKGQTVDLNDWLLYMKRPDIAQETDIVSVKMATAVPYSVTINAYTNNNPMYHVDKSELERQCNELVESKRHNAARIADYDFAVIAKNLGAYDVDVIGLNEVLACEWDQYPECSGVTVNVLGKR